MKELGRLCAKPKDIRGNELARRAPLAGNGHLTGTFKVNSGMAQMLRGRVIMDVVNVEQGKIAAVVVMVLERVRRTSGRRTARLAIRGGYDENQQNFQGYDLG